MQELLQVEVDGKPHSLSVSCNLNNRSWDLNPFPLLLLAIANGTAKCHNIQIQHKACLHYTLKAHSMRINENYFRPHINAHRANAH